MKRYVRTKDGEIFENLPLNSREIEEGLVVKGNKIFDKYYYGPSFGKFYVQYNEIGTIAEQADTIEELIKIGDLVVDTKENYGSVVNNLQYANSELDCDELYTKQGNNYILVAKKENGEWRII